MSKAFIQNRMVPDPSMTDAEFLHQKRLEEDRAARQSRKPNPDVGRVWTEENAMTRLGALCFIRRPDPRDSSFQRGKRYPHHEIVAEEFKRLYECVYGAGAAAMDPGRIQVDTSKIAHDNGIAAAVDRARKLRAAEAKMGKEPFNRLVALLILCSPAGEGLHWRERKDAIDTVLDDLEYLSSLWGYRSRAA